MADLTAWIANWAGDRFAGPARKAAASSKKMQAAIAAGCKELAGLAWNNSAAGKLRGLEGRLGKTAADMDHARRRAADLRNRINELAAPSQKLQ